MKRRAFVIFAAAGSLVAAGADDQDLKDFRAFIQEHPRALEELKRDPPLLGKAEFAQQHNVVGEYLAKHPAIKDRVKEIPRFFDDLKATTKGGEHRRRGESKAKQL